MKKFLHSILFSSLLSTSTFAQNTFDVKLDSTFLSYREVVATVNIPWEIAFGKDDFIWGTERRGRIFRLNPTSGALTYILNIESVIAGKGTSEPGLLGFAFHPNFPDSNKIFTVYNYTESGATKERLVSFEWNGTSLVKEKKLIDNIPGGNIHNGSRLLISKDNKIFMTTGEIGQNTNSQKLDGILGKVLRINLDGTIPSDNPYPNSYVYSFGHRNSQGLCFSPNGQLFSTEHGQTADDEFNIIEPKRNYGWPSVQGLCNTAAEQTFCQENNVKEPIWTWSPCVAVNDLCYYTHDAIPEWKNKILICVMGGFNNKKPRLSVMTMSADGKNVVDEKLYFQNFGRIRDICVNPKNGSIYLATNGPNYPGSGPNKIIEYSAKKQATSNNDLNNSERWITIYPTPAKTTVNFDFGKNVQGENFQIHDLNGKSIFSDKIQGMYQKMDVSNWAKGYYILSVESQKGIVSKAFLVE
jgi:glucose/arabinose dehydrogenase